MYSHNDSHTAGRICGGGFEPRPLGYEIFSKRNFSELAGVVA